MTTRTSTLAWKTIWTVEPGRLQSEGHKGSDTTEHLHTYIFLFSLPQVSTEYHGQLSLLTKWILTALELTSTFKKL